MLTAEEVQAAKTAGIVVPPSIVGATVQFVGPSWIAYGGPYEWWKIDGQLQLRKEPFTVKPVPRGPREVVGRA